MKKILAISLAFAVGSIFYMTDSVAARVLDVPWFSQCDSS